MFPQVPQYHSISPHVAKSQVGSRTGGQGTQKPARIPLSTLGVGTLTPQKWVSTLGYLHLFSIKLHKSFRQIDKYKVILYHFFTSWTWTYFTRISWGLNFSEKNHRKILAQKLCENRNIVEFNCKNLGYPLMKILSTPGYLLLLFLPKGGWVPPTPKITWVSKLGICAGFWVPCPVTSHTRN